MRKILLGLMTAGAVGGVALLATNAFFSDTETSTGNILQAGALDLKIDNTCYYNGRACIGGLWQGTEERCNCNWELKDLNEEVFFRFGDLKPGDWEEDTISIHVDNPSWLCARTRLTKNDDFSCTEPEKADDLTCTDPGVPGNANDFDGELAQNLRFVFWYDDGDNVLETGEQVISQGDQLVTFGSSWALADSQTGGGPIGPTTEDKPFFIGKAFCYGRLGLDPRPAGQNSPVGPITNSGITCDGKPVNNASQTDIVVGNIQFYAEQERHNPNFLCSQLPPFTL